MVSLCRLQKWIKTVLCYVNIIIAILHYMKCLTKALRLIIIHFLYLLFRDLLNCHVGRKIVYNSILNALYLNIISAIYSVWYIGERERENERERERELHISMITWNIGTDEINTMWWCNSYTVIVSNIIQRNFISHTVCGS